jgi:uncharacterized protein
MNRLFLSCLVLCSLVAAGAQAGEDCHIGSYRLDNGEVVDIGSPDSGTFRWRFFDGRTGALHKTTDDTWRSTYGWSDRADGITASFPDCAGGHIVFHGISGTRIAFDVRDTAFLSHGTHLVGRLVLPKGQDKVPVVVLVHGSEHDAALVDYALQRMLPAQGIGAFVYDKRGTGVSGGTYTQDFSILADDAVAAMQEAKRLAGPRLGRIGYQGGSEGGWVAPIAANRAKVDFVIVCFGLAVNVIDEDQEAVELQLSEKGYSPGEIADAKKVASAAEAVFESDFTRGIEEFDAMRAKYRHARWYKDLYGDFTFFLMPRTDAQLRAMKGPFDWHTPFRYDPMPTLRADTTPQLWILGGEDYEAPSGETSKRIKSLIADGLPFTLAYYPKAEHGMTLFETAPDGSRISTRYEPGYFALIRDFARNERIEGRYGNAELSFPQGGR